MTDRAKFKRYQVLASKRVELRGIIYAENEEDAKVYAREFWYIYDTADNTVTSGSSNKYYAPTPPVISEMDTRGMILSVYDMSDETAVRAVKCPICEMPPNKQCRSVRSNKLYPFSGSHIERHEVFKRGKK